jgi:hypothetical protein
MVLTNVVKTTLVLTTVVGKTTLIGIIRAIIPQMGCKFIPLQKGTLASRLDGAREWMRSKS